jgi:hypothetical protein
MGMGMGWGGVEVWDSAALLQVVVDVRVWEDELLVWGVGKKRGGAGGVIVDCAGRTAAVYLSFFDAGFVVLQRCRVSSLVRQ